MQSNVEIFVTTTEDESLETARFFRREGASAIITDENTGAKRIVPLAKSGLLSSITARFLSAASFFYQSINRNTTSFPVHTLLVFSDESILVEGTAAGSREIFWQEVKRAVDAKNLIALYSLDLIVVLSKRAVESNETYEQLMRLIEQNLNADVKIEVIS